MTCPFALPSNNRSFLTDRFHHRRILEHFLRVRNAHAQTLGHGERAVEDAQRRVEPIAVLLHAFLVFLSRADLRHAGGEVEQIDKAEPAGEMRRGGHVAQRRHPGHPDGTDQAAIVK